MASKNIVVLAAVILLLINACSNGMEPTEWVENFYTQPRETIYEESFDSESHSIHLDTSNYRIFNEVAYLHLNPVASSKSGSSYHWQKEPKTIPLDMLWDKLHDFALLDTVYQFKTVFDSKDLNQDLGQIGFDIAFANGGMVEFHVGKYKLRSDLSSDELDEQLLHVLIDQKNGTHSVFKNDVDISEYFILEQELVESNYILFKEKNILGFKNGIPLINPHGVRLNNIEIYHVI